MRRIERTARNICALAIAATVACAAAPGFAETKANFERHTSFVGYDWLASGKSNDLRTAGLSTQERKRRAARIAKHGNGSYICSPSGFGKKSRCYAR